jgi:hypothetical protein
MPFDPTLPQENTPLDAAQMRGQLTGLKDLIAAMPGVTGAVVDAVTTLPPGTPATAAVSLVGTELHFSFELPQGGDGAPGQEGPQGIPGEVSQTDFSNGLQNTLSQTSANTNTVNIMPFGAPADYQPLVFQDVINKVNELINALRR